MIKQSNILILLFFLIPIELSKDINFKGRENSERILIGKSFFNMIGNLLKRKSTLNWEDETHWADRFVTIFNNTNDLQEFHVIKKLLNLAIENYAGSVFYECIYYYKTVKEELIEKNKDAS